MRIKDVMTTKVEQISPSDTPERAATLMRARGVHQLVVVESGSVKGIITAHQLAEQPAGTQLPVGELMTRPVATASPELTMRQAANLMRGSAVAALPVLDGGRLVGIVTVSDLLELIGRGVERPVEKGRRAVLRSRGVVPAQTRVARR
jgi:acetoin utilization protein AcuB